MPRKWLAYIINLSLYCILASFNVNIKKEIRNIAAS